MEFIWTKFYSELADKLLLYKNNRSELIKNVYKIYDVTDISMPKLENDNNIKDIDPFSIYGLFNKAITENNRIKIVSAISEIFNISSKIPESFDGVPVLNNLRATFYFFNDRRGIDDIDNLWDLFESAIRLADSNTESNKKNFINDFNKVHDQLGILWNITMGLYWIRPYTYINLDSRNRWYILSLSNIPDEIIEEFNSKFKTLPYADDYLYICESLKSLISNNEYEYSSFPELSYQSRVVSQKVNQEKSKIEDDNLSNASFIRWFAPLIQALKDLGDSASPKEVREKIIENENLSENDINIIRGKNKVNKFENEVAFARSYLASAGYIDKSIRGVWSLTDEAKKVQMTDKLASEIFKNVNATNLNNRKINSDSLADKDVEINRYWSY
ncbi:winged helix-turn-helix domain-containing protein [uncultured Anaerococcus sp.]|uniref:winged helix-turn-helix domain-containing protein n=1 Tax=uncultured Anaerococcus sp. TaxID=293428 RepID=UPI002622891D|nr:winged helix-turn-helix domain-containing protein [uncultured Anaerococcus sp.]